jgi:molybdate transport repressor ModE-like protein
MALAPGLRSVEVEYRHSRMGLLRTGSQGYHSPVNDVDAIPGLDWSALKLLLAVARAGSLTAAARETGLSQPTLGRRIDALEARLGATLMLRGRGGVVPTETGAAVLARAERMEAEEAALLRALAGGRAEPAGDVRLTASRAVATWLLPPIAARLARTDPAIRLDVVATDEVANLLRRDADLAVRMVRPTQPELIARRLGDLPLGAYAAADYVARHGMPPPTAEGLMSHRLIGYDRSTLILDGLRAAGVAATRRDFALRTDDQIVYVRLVAAGAGIGFVARPVAEAEGLVEVPLAVCVPSLPVWLAAHRDVRTSAAVRRVADAIGEGLRAMLDRARG